MCLERVLGSVETLQSRPRPCPVDVTFQSLTDTGVSLSQVATINNNVNMEE